MNMIFHLGNILFDTLTPELVTIDVYDSDAMVAESELMIWRCGFGAVLVRTECIARRAALESVSLAVVLMLIPAD